MGGIDARALGALYQRKQRISDVERRADDAAEDVARAAAALEACAQGDLGADADAVGRALEDAAAALRKALSAVRSHAASTEREIDAAWDTGRTGTADGLPSGRGPLPPARDPEIGG